MIPIYKAADLAEKDILTRDNIAQADVEEAVSEILRSVQQEGDAALFAFSWRFDQVELSQLEIPRRELEAAAGRIDPYFRETLEMARDNISRFHSLQKPKDYQDAPRDGVITGFRYLPLERVGIYVPGGTASYPSTVLMNALPAKIAGVKEVVMVTPPNKATGKVRDELLAAAWLAGVDRVFAIGGAQAVAALAYGTETVPKVDKIVGPGNIFVATAKRRVFGLVDIDMIAGPSEILVIADENSDPAFVAADLLSQAEHDKLASAVLITTSPALAQQVQAEVERQLADLPRQEIARCSMENNGKILLADSLEEAVSLSNRIAPEHLELCVDEPFALLPQIKNAGSVFLGRSAPEALGDYLAGPNHTLPTSGTARFSSPLSVDDFIKKSSYLWYTPEALARVGDRVADFAAREGLDAHGRSVLIRTKKERD